MIPSTFAPIYPQDFNLTPIDVFKQYSVSGSEFQISSSGYLLQEGLFTTRKTPIGTDESLNDPINDNGTYKHIIWKHVDHMYYRNPYDSFKSNEGANKRFIYKFLFTTASLISIPYLKYGDSIKKESVLIKNDDLGIILKDDGNGNLYDVSLQTNLSSSCYLNKNNLICYIGFNEVFRKLKFGYGLIDKGESLYQSSVYSPNETYKIDNVVFSEGIKINSTGSGLCAEFSGNSTIHIHNRKELDFDSIDNFTISFWIHPESNTSGSLISKRGTIFKDVLGYEDKVLATTGIIVQDKYISSSFINTYTDIYPYDFSISGSKLYFKRSDGIHTIILSGSLVTGSWNHISAIKHNNYCALFINDQFKQQVNDNTINPLNGYDIILGASNLNKDNSITCKLDELRFYNSSFIIGTNISGSTFHTNLYTSSYCYNTPIVGNVFYRTGNIVINSMNSLYNRVVQGTNWVLNYEGTHTIYEYSILSRIRKGDFNLTLNPSARRSPKSDQLISDFTGSLLRPYATTIGFYNDKGELLVIAKLGQPLQMREDVDINILTKFDS